MPRDEHRQASHDADAGPADQLPCRPSDSIRQRHAGAAAHPLASPSPSPATSSGQVTVSEASSPAVGFWQSTASTAKERKMQANSLDVRSLPCSAQAKGIVVFSGAGLSADSGIPAFRDGATGLWNTVDPDEVARIEGFPRHPARVWSWLLELKKLGGRTATERRSPGPRRFEVRHYHRDSTCRGSKCRKLLPHSGRRGHRHCSENASMKRSLPPPKCAA
jgi:hypothetical protein